MRIQELGKAIRNARNTRGLTQARLAARAGLSLNTLNRLENGLFPDLGVKKVDAILKVLGMELSPRKIAKAADYVDMASSSASVSFRKQLTPEELVHALLSGKTPPGKEAHFIALLEESPHVLFDGLMKQVGAWGKPGKVEKNVQKIARHVGLVEGHEEWKKAA